MQLFMFCDRFAMYKEQVKYSGASYYMNFLTPHAIIYIDTVLCNNNTAHSIIAYYHTRSERNTYSVLHQKQQQKTNKIYSYIYIEIMITTAIGGNQ